MGAKIQSAPVTCVAGPKVCIGGLETPIYHKLLESLNAIRKTRRILIFVKVIDNLDRLL